MTQTQGTLTHMPPEVLAEGKVTKSADVYAFGVILWEMFTGERPFAGMRHAQILEAVMSASAAPPLELSSRAPASFKVVPPPSCDTPLPQPLPGRRTIVVQLKSLKWKALSVFKNWR